jgi:hypothetical protein
MRRHGSTTIFDADDIAAAFGIPSAATKCGGCGHERHWHRREIIVPGPAPEHHEESHECERRDRRRKAGVCSCEKFVEPSTDLVIPTPTIPVAARA